MSDSDTLIRGWPVPPGDLTGEFSDMVDELDATVRDLEGVGRILSIDEDEVRGGIDDYDDVIETLHDAGLNVYARNLDGDELPARIEWWPADRDRQRRRVDPLTLRIVIGREDVEAAALAIGGDPDAPITPDTLDDAKLATVVRTLLAEPALPAGLLSTDVNSRYLEYTKPGPAELSRFRGSLAGTYTPAKAEHTLGLVSCELRLRLCCVWGYVDNNGPAGSSLIVAVIHGQARQLPVGLQALLVDGEGDGLIDGRSMPDGQHPLVDWQALPGYRSEQGHTRALEDRRHP
jgi:hypothetical protein